jgi:hypothetical protein
VADTLELKRFIKRCADCAQKFSHDAMFCPFDGTKLVEVAWEPTADPLIEKVVDGRYRVRHVLGEGGMGTVYEVEHTTLHRPFAMKVLRRDLAREPDLAARFMQEARATASIKHPNVVAISDFGRLPDDVPYFVMELLIGQTLSTSIKTGGPMPAARGIRIILQIAAALGAAHQARVVHRDLKPENVFLVGVGAGAVSADVTARDDVRIVDFGAAMILGASRLTKTGIVFGTPHYMSPEQASGQPVDHRADIYALGVIMYEMFTGKVPFEADTYMGVLTQHMFVQPVPPSQVSAASKHLGALEDVTLRALEKKPEQRYATMEELAAEIQRAVSFDADGGVRIASGARARSSGGGGAGAKVFGLANELELPSTDEVAARSAPSVAAEARRRRAQRWMVYGALALGVAAASAVAARAARVRSPEAAPRPSSVALPAAAASSAPPGAPPSRAYPPVTEASPTSASPGLAPAVDPSSAVAPAATGPRAPARPARPSTSVSPRRAGHPAAPPPGDFRDPWAK